MQPFLDRNYLLALPPAIALAAIAIGVPTDVLPNPWFTRMTPVSTLDTVFWIATSVAVGALAATFVFGVRTKGNVVGTAGSSVAGALAVGCPVCNKLVVAALGTSGALTYFAPLQPALAAGAIALSLWALRVRIARLRTCSVAQAEAGAGAATS